MPEANSLLERMRVASPCPASWEAMEGDERVRFCRTCSLHVYNISEMKRAEAEALLARSGGRLCARLYRRADGTVITKDCPRGLSALRRRVARRAGAALAALLALAGGAFGQRPGQDDKRQSSEARQKSLKVRRDAKNGQSSAFKGIIKDRNGAVIAGARVLIAEKGKEPKYAAVTTDQGKFEVASLPPGAYDVEIFQPGFKRFVLERFEFAAGEAVEIDLVLEVTAEEVLLGVIAVESPLDSGPGIRHVFTREQIKRLPY